MQTAILKTYDNYFTANIMLTRLRDAGIQCFLVDENTATIYPVLMNAIGGIKLTVDVNDLELATQLMQDYEADYLRSISCPGCAGNNMILVSKPGAGNFVTAILTWLFSSYALAPEKVYQCQDCGFESASLPENQAEYN